MHMLPVSRRVQWRLLLLGVCLGACVSQTISGDARTPVAAQRTRTSTLVDGVAAPTSRNLSHETADTGDRDKVPYGVLSKDSDHTSFLQSKTPYGYYERPESPHHSALKWLGISFIILMGVGLVAAMVACLFTSSPYGKERLSYH